MLYTVATINTGQVLGRNQVQIFVRLVDRNQRRLNVDQMSVPLRERLASIPGITVTQVGLLDAVGSGKPIQLSLQGTDLRELERLTAQLMPRLAAVPGLVDLDSSSKPNKPELSIRVKRDAASDAGLSVGAITSALRSLVAGQTLGNWRADDDQNYDVKVRLTPESRVLASRHRTPGPDHWQQCRRLAAHRAAVAGGRGGAHQRRQPDQPPRHEPRGGDHGQRLRPRRRPGGGRHPQDPRGHRLSAGLQLPLRRLHQGHAGELCLCGVGAGRWA